MDDIEDLVLQQNIGPRGPITIVDAHIDDDSDSDTELNKDIIDSNKFYLIQNLDDVLDTNFQSTVPLEEVEKINNDNDDIIHPSLKNLDVTDVPDEQMVPYVDMNEKYREWFRLRLKFLHKSKEIGLENKVPESQKDSLVFQSETISYTNLHDGPIIYVNGRTQYGESIFLRVYGFKPFFYMKVPKSWDTPVTAEFMKQLSKRLYNRLWYSIRWKIEHTANNQTDFHRTEIMYELLNESTVGGTGNSPIAHNPDARPTGTGCKMITSWSLEQGRGLQDYVSKRDIEDTDTFIRIEVAVPELVKECKVLIMNHRGGSEGLFNKELMDQPKSRRPSATTKKEPKPQKNTLNSWIKKKKGKGKKTIDQDDMLLDISTNTTTINRKYINPWLSKELDRLSPDRFYVYEANVDFITRFMVALNKNDSENSVVNKRNMGHNPETCLYVNREDYQDSIIKNLFEHDDLGVPIYPPMDAPDSVLDTYIQRILESITPKDNESDITSISSCDLEVAIQWETLHVPDISLKCYDRIYPRQVMSYDIEARPKDNGGFPTAEDDPVIDICSIMYNTETPGVYDGVDMIVGRCNIEGSDITQEKKYKLNSVSINCFKTEADMFRGYHTFIHMVDPDLITGFNIERFDNVYLLKRAETLGVDIFKYLGRNLCQPSYSKRTLFESSARGAVESYFTFISGRQQLDVWKYTSNSQKLSEYNLDAISKKILDLNKIDVHYSQIARLLRSPKGRRTLRVYCSFDALLSLLIMNFWEQYISTICMTRVVGTMFQNVLERGQQFRIFTMLVRYTKQRRKMVLGDDKKEYTLPLYFVPVMYEDEKPSESYKGASVANPNKGLYTDIVITQDFSGLYPSIMMAHNMCYCSYITYERANELGLELGKDYYSTPRFEISDDLEHFEEIIDPEQPCFVYPHIQPGFMPMMLSDLKVERGIANKEKSKYDKKTRLYANLEAKQLSLKTVSNSGYGFTGVGKRGMLPKTEIASAVTDTGRFMINKVRYTVKQEFVKNRGMNLTVLYGDTDSVMIIMHGYTVAEAEKIGVEMSKYMSSMFRAPIYLDYEKLFIISLFFKVKKKYVGIKKLLDKDELIVHPTGIDSNRRDGIPYMNKITESIIDNLLMKKDFNKMLETLKQQIHDFKMGNFSMLDIISTKKYSKTFDSYTNVPLVPQLAKKMFERDPNNAPKPGDRVPFVIISDPSKEIVERGEDPLYAYEHNLTIDIDHYIEKNLYEPIKRILDPIIRVGPKTAINKNTITESELRSIFFNNDGLTLKRVIPKTLGIEWKGFENIGRCFICNNICTKVNTTTNKSNILCDKCVSSKPFIESITNDHHHSIDEDMVTCSVCKCSVDKSDTKTLERSIVCNRCISYDPVNTVKTIIDTKWDSIDVNLKEYDNECMVHMNGDRELVEKCNSKQCKTFWLKRLEQVKFNEIEKLKERYDSQFTNNDDSVIWKDIINDRRSSNNSQRPITLSIVGSKDKVIKKRKINNSKSTTTSNIEPPTKKKVKKIINETKLSKKKSVVVNDNTTSSSLLSFINSIQIKR